MQTGPHNRVAPMYNTRLGAKIELDAAIIVRLQPGIQRRYHQANLSVRRPKISAYSCVFAILTRQGFVCAALKQLAMLTTKVQQHGEQREFDAPVVPVLKQSSQRRRPV